MAGTTRNLSCCWHNIQWKDVWPYACW